MRRPRVRIYHRKGRTMTSETQALVSLGVSILAFVVSGATLGWTIRKDLLDEGRLKVTLMVGRLTVGGQSGAPLFLASDLYAERVASGLTKDDGGRNVLVATITNVGRRPIVVTKVAGRASGNQWFVPESRLLPKTLKPGEFATEWFDNPLTLGERVRSFYAFDSSDRPWRVSGRNFKAAKANAKRFQIGGR